MEASNIIVIRGGGDLATGVIQKFHRSGLKVVVLEIEKPSAIRRSVSLCEAVYDGHAAVEDISCALVTSISEIENCRAQGTVPLMIDPSGESLPRLKPIALIDAIMAKRSIGTHKGMAPLTIALGPGFCAGEDVHAVIETKRGHDLGRLILRGRALPDTGIPGDINGKSAERVIRAPAAGEVRHLCKIGDIVEAGQLLCEISGTAVTAPFKGLLRGLIREGLQVPSGMKIADMDPRLDINWRTISDKARCIGGAALEAFFLLSQKKE